MLQRSPLLHFEQRTYQMALGRDLERSTTVPERDLPAQRAACEPSDLGKTPHLRPPNVVRLSCGAELERSQTEDYRRRRGAVSFRRLLGGGATGAIGLARRR